MDKKASVSQLNSKIKEIAKVQNISVIDETNFDVPVSAIRKYI